MSAQSLVHALKMIGVEHVVVLEQIPYFGLVNLYWYGEVSEADVERAIFQNTRGIDHVTAHRMVRPT